METFNIGGRNYRADEPLDLVPTAVGEAVYNKHGRPPRANEDLFWEIDAKWMRAKGVPKWEVEAQSGHKSGTMDRYATVAPEYLQNACRAIQVFYDRSTRHLPASE